MNFIKRPHYVSYRLNYLNLLTDLINFAFKHKQKKIDPKILSNSHKFYL